MAGKNSSSIRTDLKLNDNLVIKSAGSDLYRIGLSLFTLNGVKRKFVYNPYFTSIITYGYTLKLFVSLLIHSNDRRVCLLLGDFPYFIGLQWHLGISCVLHGLVPVFSQTIHLWYYWKGIEPTYLRPFLMMSGMISPESIGLTDSRIVERLLKRSRLQFFICHEVLKSRIPTGALVSGIPFAMKCSLFEFFLLGIPWVTLFTLWVYVTSDYIFHQVNYFSIICYYLKLKLKVLNTRIETQIKIGKRLNITDVKDLCKSYDSIHREIKQFNDNMWSSFLASFVFIFMLTITIVIYSVIYGSFGFILKIVFIYIFVAQTIFLLSIIWTASSVGVEANKSYPLLNKLYVRSTWFFLSVYHRIKVILFLFYTIIDFSYSSTVIEFD